MTKYKRKPQLLPKTLMKPLFRLTVVNKNQTGINRVGGQPMKSACINMKVLPLPKFLVSSSHAEEAIELGRGKYSRVWLK